MNHRRAIAIAGVFAAALAAGPADAEWSGTPSGLAGTARVDDGEWIYQDFVYDDYGADSAGGSNIVLLAPTSGDFRYPEGEEYAGNAADVIEVRARPEGNDLRLRVRLSTWIDASTPVIGIGIETGAGVSRAWPFAAGVTSVWDRFATVAEGRVFLAVADEPPTEIGEAEVDLAENTVELVVPGVGDGAAVDLTIGAGLWDGAAGEWRAGSPGGAVPGTFSSGAQVVTRVFDLAFNSREIEPRGGRWQEVEQSRALTLGDVAAFRQRVDLDRIRSGAIDDPITAPGFYNRHFTSIQDLGEGVGEPFPQYKGKVQPYGLWLPDGYDPDAATPLVLVLHSLSVHHNQYSGGGPEESATSYFTFNEQIGDGLGAILATPLCRGPDGWYENECLVDTLEVLRDVQEHYDVDPERIYLTGYSMGGYGTYQIGTLLPEIFAGAVSWAGVPTAADRLENLHSIPIQIVHGTNDELVPVTGVIDQAARLRELGYAYRFHLHPGLDHFLFVWLDRWERTVQWLGGRKRVENPPRVVFRLRPEGWASSSRSDADPATIRSHVATLGFELDSSYWVRDVVVRDPSVTGEVDALSHAIADRDPAVTEFSSVGAGPPTPYVEEGVVRTLAPLATENALDVGLEGIDEATILVDRAGLDAGSPILVDAASDGTTTLHLDGSFGGSPTVEDANTLTPIASSFAGGVLTFDVSGEQALRVVP